MSTDKRNRCVPSKGKRRRQIDRFVPSQRPPQTKSDGLVQNRATPRSENHPFVQRTGLCSNWNTTPCPAHGACGELDPNPVPRARGLRRVGPQPRAQGTGFGSSRNTAPRRGQVIGYGPGTALEQVYVRVGSITPSSPQASSSRWKNVSTTFPAVSCDISGSAKVKQKKSFPPKVNT